MIRVVLSVAAACCLSGCQNEPAAMDLPPPEQPSRSIIKDVSVETAARLIREQPGLIILDLRTPQEFAEGHLQNARLMDFNAPDFSEKISGLDPGKPYLIHCAAGGRSTQSLVQFEELGFTEIYHMKAGIKGWAEAGNPTTRDSTRD